MRICYFYRSVRSIALWLIRYCIIINLCFCLFRFHFPIFGINDLIILTESVHRKLINTRCLRLVFPCKNKDTKLFFNIFPRNISFNLSILFSPLKTQSVPMKCVISVQSQSVNRPACTSLTIFCFDTLCPGSCINLSFKNLAYPALATDKTCTSHKHLFDILTWYCCRLFGIQVIVFTC